MIVIVGAVCFMLGGLVGIFISNYMPSTLED